MNIFYGKLLGKTCKLNFYCISAENSDSWFFFWNPTYLVKILGNFIVQLKILFWKVHHLKTLTYYSYYFYYTYYVIYLFPRKSKFKIDFMKLRPVFLRSNGGRKSSLTSSSRSTVTAGRKTFRFRAKTRPPVHCWPETSKLWIRIPMFAWR